MSIVYAALRETENKSNLGRSFLLHLKLVDGSSFVGAVCGTLADTKMQQALEIVNWVNSKPTDDVIYISIDHVILCYIEYIG